MRAKRLGASPGLYTVLRLFSIGPAFVAANAEEPPVDPEPELQDSDPDNDEEPPVEEPVPDEEPEDEGAAEESAEDDFETDAASDIEDERDDSAIVEDMDDDWAYDVVADESDDAIPADLELNPTGKAWEVIEFADDGDNQEEGAESSTGEVRDPADMPIVRRPVKGAPAAPGARPAPGTKPASGGSEDTAYSTGGKPIRAGGAPWQAQIYYPRQAPQWADKLRNGTPLWQLQHYCGGVLIADDWVLTAAHCIDEDMVKAGYRVRLGASDISKEEGMTYRIDRIVRHSQYQQKKLPAPPPNMYANDIALVRIADDRRQGPRDPVRIHAIPLFEGMVAPGAEVTGTGWGKTEAVESHAPSAVLMKVDLRAMDTDVCKSRPAFGSARIHGGVICASHPQRSTCQGDSGGALTFTNGAPKVVGIVSWGKKRCSGDGQPGVYTRIESYLVWIKQAMQLDPSKNALP